MSCSSTSIGEITANLLKLLFIVIYSHYKYFTLYCNLLALNHGTIEYFIPNNFPSQITIYIILSNILPSIILSFLPSNDNKSDLSQHSSILHNN